MMYEWEWEEDLGFGAYTWHRAQDQEEAMILAEFRSTATGRVRKLRLEVVFTKDIDEVYWEEPEPLEAPVTKCPHCGGSGGIGGADILSDPPEICPVCEGEGVV